MSATVRIVPSNHEFVVEAGEPLLDAALRSGLALEFGCTNGSCGECRGRIREGQVRRIRFHDYVISDAEKREGTVLLCCYTAATDVTIEAGEASGPDDIPVQNLRARLYRRERVATAVEVVHLRVMRGKMLRFLAGQHVTLKLAGAKAEEVSIASCPCDGLNLEFHFSTDCGGELGARALAGFSKSDRFGIEGPRGRFTLDEDSRRPLVFIARNTAIAPVKSIIEHAINLEIPQPMYLRWHANRPDGHYLHNYFRSLTDALDEFDYQAVAGPADAGGFEDFPDPRNLDAYVSGDDAFVNAAAERLLASGLPQKRLFVNALHRRPRRAPTAD